MKTFSTFYVYYYIEKDIFITVNWAGRRLFRTIFFTCLKAIFLLQQTGRGLLRPKFLYRYKNDIFIYIFDYRIKVFAHFFLISIISLLLIQSKRKRRESDFLAPLHQTPSRRIAAHARDSKVSLLAG